MATRETKSGVPIEVEDFVLRVITQYPYFHRGLEVGCGDGQRIRIARRRGQNLYGTDPKDWKNSWMAQGIDPYCQISESQNLPFNDETFDFVIHPKPINEWPILVELSRVASRTIWAKCRLGEDADKWFWLDIAVEFGCKVEGFTESTEGNLILEMRK